MATFISSRSVGSSLYIGASTTSGYWKCTKWNGTVTLGSGTSGNKVYIGLSPNEPLTIVPCHSDGSIDATGHITGLDLGYNNLTSINLTGLSYLTNLNIPGNQLTSINLTGLSSLTQLNLSDNQLTSFNGSGLSSLIQLHLSGNQLTSFHGYTFSPTGLASLTYLDLQNNQLTSFNGSGLTGLTQLHLSSNQLTSFVGTDLSSLTDLYLHENQLTSFNGTGLSSLTELNLNNNQLTGFTGTGLSDLTDLYLHGNQLTSFNGAGLTSLTNLSLTSNQLSTFDGSGLSSLTTLDLTGNPLVTFIGGDMGLILGLNFSTGGGKGSSGWNITTLETFDGTGLSSLTSLNLTGNPLTTFIGGDMGITSLNFSSGFGGWNITTLETCDIAGLSGLNSLNLTGNQLTPQNWDSILSDLVDLENDGGSLSFGTAQRTAASTADYDTLIDREWTINDTFEIYAPSTFITSKAVGEYINIFVETTTAYWKYKHNGEDSSVFHQYDGEQSIEVLNANGEFTIISCDPEGTMLGEGAPNGEITTLYLDGNQLTEFNGTGLSGLTYLGLSNNQLTSFNGTGLASLTYLELSVNLLTTFDGTDLTSLTELYLPGNLLTGLDVSPMTSLTNLTLNEKEGTNPLTASANDSILGQLVTNGLYNGTFVTIGGRTAASNDDYDTLISRGWTIEGANIPQWYRFKAPSTEAWDGIIGFNADYNIKQIWLYQSGGFTYYDFLTSETIGEVRFNIQGTETEIVATQVPVTLQEFSSSGSFTAGIGLEGNAVGYANTTAFGSWGTLNSGTLPAIPSRYEGDVPAGSVIFSDATLEDGSICGITAPILLSLTVNGNEISLTGINGNPTGTQIPVIGFGENDEVTFSMTWGELVEVTPLRKLRVKGMGQRN